MHRFEQKQRTEREKVWSIDARAFHWTAMGEGVADLTDVAYFGEDTDDELVIPKTFECVSPKTHRICRFQVLPTPAGENYVFRSVSDGLTHLTIVIVND